jgi:hypothetical protein
VKLILQKFASYFSLIKGVSVLALQQSSSISSVGGDFPTSLINSYAASSPGISGLQAVHPTTSLINSCAAPSPGISGLQAVHPKTSLINSCAAPSHGISGFRVDYTQSVSGVAGVSQSSAVHSVKGKFSSLFIVLLMVHKNS